MWNLLQLLQLYGCWNENSCRISKWMDIAVSQLNLIYKTGGGSDLAWESEFANPCFRGLHETMQRIANCLSQKLTNKYDWHPHPLHYWHHSSAFGRMAPRSMGFPRQEYWSELPFPSAGDHPSTGIQPGSPALQADSLPIEPPGRPFEASGAA